MKNASHDPSRLERSFLRTLYDRASTRYDLQHGLVTLWSDERGRVVVVDLTRGR